MMIVARLAVLGAIACTLWFNGSYAWSKGDTIVNQLGMVALALSIDLCKCSFLPAASLLWRSKWYLPALVLIPLWLAAFAYSTFAGYAYLTGNRSAVTITEEAAAGQRIRAQADYDAATADLAIGKRATDWTVSAACTAPRNHRQRSFCANVARTQSKLTAASDVLTRVAPVRIEPEVSVIAANTGWAASSIRLLVALVPAALIELVASLGLYALTGRALSERSGNRAESVSPSTATSMPANVRSSSTGALKSSGATSSAARPVSPSLGQLTWSKPRTA